MKTILKTISLSFLMIIALSLSSCRMSTNELAEKVKISMQETWSKEDVTGIKIENFTLTHKGGNEYSGLLETDENGENFKYTVEVIYDGENMKWEIID